MLMRPQFPVDAFEQAWKLVLAIARLPDGQIMRKAKPEALAQWRTLEKRGDVSFESIMHALERCRDEYSKPVPKGGFRPMVPYFCRWLKNKRYIDYLDEDAAPAFFMVQPGSPQQMKWEIHLGRKLLFGKHGWQAPSEWPPEAT